VDIKPNIGAQIPLDAVFVDENGKEIRLRDYITGDKPVIMSLGYYRCPLLCDLVLNGVVDALKGVEWDPGDQFEMITISIDPKETPTLAKLKKQNYVRGYGKPSANRGWHFLTGKQESITAVANAVGFYYRYDEKQDQFIHGAAVFLLTPDGKLSRCLRGIMFDSQTVRLSLAEASEGKQVSTFDSLLLLCFHYDETEGTYSLQAMNVMRIGGVMVMVVLAAILFPAWLRSRKRKTDIPKPEDG
jgi:protein SCO1